MIFFFGLFWSSVLSATSVFQVFDTRLLFRDGERMKGIRRLAAGIIIIDIFPLILLVGFLMFFPNESAAQISTIVAAAILSISVFSAQRFLHSVVATRWSDFFYSEEDAMALKDRGKTVDPLAEHLVPAIGYLVMPIVVSMVILWLF